MSPISAPAAPAAPTGTPAAPAAPAKSLFPGLAGPTGPVAPGASPAPTPGAPPAGPVAPVAPGAPAPAPAPTAPRAAFFGITPPPDPAAPAPGDAPEFDATAHAKKLISEIFPDSFLQSNDPNIKNFAGVRDGLTKAIAKANEAEMKAVRAHKTVDPALREELTTTKAKLAEFEPRIAKLTMLEAREELADNDQFAAAYTDKLSGIRAEMLATAKEGGVDAALVEKALAATTKLGAAKAFAEVTDPEAKQMLTDLARQNLEISQKFAAEWKDPVKAVTAWRAEAAKSGAARSTRNTQEAVALHRTAMKAAIEGDPAKGIPGNFVLASMLQNPKTAAIFQEIEQQYAGNVPIAPGQVIADRVQAATVPHLVLYTEHLETRIAEMTQKLIEYGELQPDGVTPGQLAGGAPPAGGAGKSLWNFPAPRTGPVVTAENAGQMGAGLVAPGATRA